MRLPLADPLELLSDFVQRTQSELEVQDVTQDPADLVHEEERSRTEQERARVGDRLQHAVRDAIARNDTQLKTLLERLQKAIEPGAVQDEAAFEAMKNPARLLEQDGFGNQRPALPPAVKDALDFIARYQVPELEANAQPDFEGAPADADEAAALELAQLVEGAPVDGAMELPDREELQIREFVAKYFAEHFEDAAPPRVFEKPAPQLVEVPELPAFETMSPEEQHFVLTADDRELAVYARLPAEQKSVFRELRPEQRGEFLKLSPDEKQFVRMLDPEDRQLFLALNPDHRAQLRQMSPEQRKQYFGELKAQQAQAAKEPPAKVARELGQTLLKNLGVPLAEQSPLLEKARSLAFNYLHQSKGDLLAAQTGAMKALLALPEVQQALEKEVAASLAQPAEAAEVDAGAEAADSKEQPEHPARRHEGKDRPHRAQPGADYLGHLQRIRHTLPDFAQRMVQPGLSRQQLVEGLRKAVVISADFADAYPARQGGRGGRGDPVRRGFLSRQLRG